MPLAPTTADVAHTPPLHVGYTRKWITAFRQSAENRSNKARKGGAVLMNWLEHSVPLPNSVNADLVCPHGGLSKEGTRIRKRVEQEVFDFLTTHYEGVCLPVRWS